LWRDAAVTSVQNASRRRGQKGSRGSDCDAGAAGREHRDSGENMRAVVQRVSRAKVTVEKQVTGEIAAGLMILLGVGKEDNSAVAAAMAEKLSNLRIFEDAAGKMNLSLIDVKGSALVVSQFTLYGDARGQRRPSFILAAPPDLAKKLYEEFCETLKKLGIPVATGIFQAMMSVELVNEGPVTILVDSDKTF
jgi:D-aminoacyl-tRNA deacylase